MAATFDKPVVCPILIGRTPYLESLDRFFERMKSGNGQTVLVSGEAGIGKSRLVAEARRRAAQHEVSILQGNCFEPDRSLPYGLLLDLLRTFMGTFLIEDSTTYIKPLVPELMKVLPDLSAWFPEVTPTPPLEPEQEKRRLFGAFAQFFLPLAARRPLLIIGEDLHWSDDTSLEFLLYLARRIASLPLLLLLTYRSDELHAGLRHFLAVLDRERLAIEMPLNLLSHTDVEAMLRTIFEMQRPVRSDFLNAIFTLTEGNPFFIEEVLRSLIAAGEIFYTDRKWDRKPVKELSIPRSIQDAVQRRLEPLSEKAKQALALAAVAGQRFDFALLQLLTGLDEDELLGLIKELIAAQLVEEESAERFVFRHALTRQAIYGELLGRERKKLHGRIAAMMERHYEATLEAHLADLAYHFYEAGSWEQALEYALRAGERAQALYANHAAVEHFTRALVAARYRAGSPVHRLYQARGQVYVTIGEFEKARADYEQALEVARQSSEGVAEWRSMLDLGFLWVGRDYEQAGEWFRSAIKLAQSLDDPKYYARSLNRYGNWLVNMGQAAEGIALHHQALEIFRTRDDTPGTAETLDLLGMANGIYGDLVSAVKHYGDAITLFRELGDKETLSSSLASRSVWASPGLVETCYSALGKFEECARDAAEALRLAQQTGMLAGQAYIGISRGQDLAGFGELGEGLACVQQAFQIATEIEHLQWQAGLYNAFGRLYLCLLAPGQAIEHLLQGLALAHKLGSAWWKGNITYHLAQAFLLQHDYVRAEAVLKALMSRDQPPRNLPERRVALTWGQLALAQGEPRVALRIAEELLLSAPGQKSDQPIPALLKLKGEAFVALQRPEEATRVLEEAKRGAHERMERVLLWQIHRSLGHVYALGKHEAEAHHELAEARSIIEVLAATIDDAELRENFLQAALDSLAKEKAVPLHGAHKQAFGGLTFREGEVAVLVSHGKSSREIAEELVLSERTVESHVGNILSKLGFTSRVQIAAWVVEKGLAKLST